MKIILLPEFYPTLKNRFVLLDTNVFIDAYAAPGEYGKFFVSLKQNGVTLTTINSVKLEFIRGSANEKRFNDKNEYMDSILDATLPITEDNHKNALELVKSYQIDGKNVSTVDFLLGGTLIKYKKRICLMTRDIDDFPTNIFNLDTLINVVKNKTIHTYGFFSYNK